MADIAKAENPQAKVSEAKAVAKYIRISPRKVRLVVDLIRGKGIEEALAILKYAPQGASEPVHKVLKSAIANAEHNYDMIRDDLFVAECYVDEGPTLKRYLPRARGRADMIRKRTCHITIVVKEKTAVKEG